MRIHSMLLITLLGASTALAAPLRAKNGESMRVRVAGKSERGIGLRQSPAHGTWRLELSAPAGEVANVYDVTVGVAETKWVVPVQAGGLTFDAGRFVAGHAYRVELPGADAAIVYLYAPPRSRSSRVVFRDHDEPATNDDGISITPKSAL